MASSKRLGAADGPELHLIDEATCATSPVRAAWLADYAATRPTDSVVVFASGKPRWARRAGLRPTRVDGRRLPLPWKLAWCMFRLQPEPGAGLPWGSARDWSLGHRFARLWQLGPVAKLPEMRELPAACLDVGRLDPADRQTLRSEWALTPGTRVAWLAADTRWSQAMLTGAASTGLAAEAGREWALLVAPGMPELRRVRRLFAGMDRDRRLIVDDRALEPWRVMAGCDAALMLSDAVGLSGRWAALAGLPIIAAREAASVDSLVEAASEGAVTMTGDARARTIARALCRLSEAATQR